MTIKQMEYILELARTGNFNRAAENLFISQPALTYQIQKAEEELGFEVFIRSGRGAGLTAAGERLAGGLVQVLSDYEETVSEARSLGSDFAASIRLAMPYGLCIPRLSEIIEEFSDENPKSPVLIKSFVQDSFHGEELPDADIIIIEQKEKRIRHREWREHAALSAYVSSGGLPKAGDMVYEKKEIPKNVPQDIVGASGEGDPYPVVWIPYMARPVSACVLIKKDEKREIIHIFASKFVQIT